MEPRQFAPPTHIPLHLDVFHLIAKRPINISKGGVHPYMNVWEQLGGEHKTRTACASMYTQRSLTLSFYLLLVPVCDRGWFRPFARQLQSLENEVGSLREHVESATQLQYQKERQRQEESLLHEKRDADGGDSRKRSVEQSAREATEQAAEIMV